MKAEGGWGGGGGGGGGGGVNSAKLQNRPNTSSFHLP